MNVNRRGALIVLAVVVAIGLLAPARVDAVRGGAAGDQNFPPQTGGTPFIVGPPTATPQESTAQGSLAKGQQQQASTVALHNKYVKALLSHTLYHVQSTHAWKGKSVPLGAICLIRFSRPLALSGTWIAPVSKPYQHSYRNVKGLKVYVDLRRSRVVGVRPLER